jgi:F-type H+-transporting ATPase subunit b
MPQIDQLSAIYASQLFWLAVTFGLIYFGIGRGMLPKIQATVGERDKRIADDLATAEQASKAADTIEEAYRQKTAESRAAALAAVQAAKQASALENEKRIATADAEIGGKVAAAEAELRAQTDKALAEIGDAAAQAAQDMVAKLSGASVTKAQASKAVKAALTHG